MAETKQPGTVDIPQESTYTHYLMNLKTGKLLDIPAPPADTSSPEDVSRFLEEQSNETWANGIGLGDKPVYTSSIPGPPRPHGLVDIPSGVQAPPAPVEAPPIAIGSDPIDRMHALSPTATAESMMGRAATGGAEAAASGGMTVAGEALGVGAGVLGATAALDTAKFLMGAMKERPGSISDYIPGTPAGGGGSGDQGLAFMQQMLAQLGNMAGMHSRQ